MTLCLTIVGLSSATHARNPAFAFRDGDVFTTGQDPVALLVVPRGANDANSSGDLYISSYREGSVLRAGRNAAGFTSALNAIYYDDREFKGKHTKRRDSAVDFDWGVGAPLPGFGRDSFSVRWTGTFRAEQTGRYRFTTRSDDGVRLWINGKQIIDRWHDMAAAFHSGEIELQGGRSYKLRMDYYENGGGAVARLFWQPPGATKRTLMRRLDGFTPQSKHAAGLGARALATGDVNGDGRPDLAIANYNYDGTVTLLLSQESGGFRTQTVVGVGDDPIDLALADLNGDRLPELIVLNRSSADVRIFAHAGGAGREDLANPEDAGTTEYFPAANVRIALPAQSGPAAQLAALDLNGDRQRDLLILAGDLYFVPQTGNDRERRLSSAFASAPRALIDDPKFAEDRRQRQATSFAAADLDRDDDLDIVVAFADRAGRRAYLSCLRNQTEPARGAAAESPAFIRAGPLSTLPGQKQQAPDANSANAGNLSGTAVVRARDLDGDGLADLVFNHPALPGLGIYRNTSRKSEFSPNALRPQKFPALPAPATDLRLADLNDDGKIDVAVLHGGVSQASVYLAR